jgi:hypothetical protein
MRPALRQSLRDGGQSWRTQFSSFRIFVVATHPGLGILALGGFVTPQRRKIEVMVSAVQHVGVARVA